jgi:hypothetical protein
MDDPKYEEQFTAIIDFLGFREVSKATDDSKREQILMLLQSLAAMRGEFDLNSKFLVNGFVTSVRPAITAFSDHVLVSFPLESIADGLRGTNCGDLDRAVSRNTLGQFCDLVRTIAAAALRIGLLIRGGATIGRLYHHGGVVFGEALVEAHELESGTAIYPRIVLSHKITARRAWREGHISVGEDRDGLFFVDYFKSMFFAAGSRGDNHATEVKAWFETVLPIIAARLQEFEESGRQREFAKWTWFAKEFRRGVEYYAHMNFEDPDALRRFGVSLDMMPWK